LKNTVVGGSCSVGALLKGLVGEGWVYFGEGMGKGRLRKLDFKAILDQNPWCQIKSILNQTTRFQTDTEPEHVI